MSATIRGGAREAHDYYPTPAWALDRLLDLIAARLPRGVWYEPCAGDGALVRAARRYGLRGVEWRVNELRSEARAELENLVGPEAVTIGDVLTAEALDPPPAVVLTNPPIALAWRVLTRLLTRYPDAHVVMLLRLGIWGSAKRQTLLRSAAPDTYVLPNRPGFTADGRTDAAEYAWLHWRPGDRRRRCGRICVLGQTRAWARGEG